MSEEKQSEISEEITTEEISVSENAIEAASSEESGQGEPQIEEQMEESEKMALLEALLFVAGEPLSLEVLAQISRIPPEEIEVLMARMAEGFIADEKGIELVIVASQYQLRTKARFAPFIRELKDGGPKKLSGPALETLSIVAYRQPIVKSDVEKIRGVDATPTLKTLIERNLIRIVGHQASVGQPALYGTTDEFLKLFGLSSLSQLPTLRDIGEIESDPGESPEETEQMAEDDLSAAEPAIEDPQAVLPQ